jgi:small neutral amino acid transporter SnatA (MarC family)
VTDPSGGSAPRTPGRALRGRSTLLLAAAAWTIWVWATRIWNIVGDPAHDAAFKAVHSLLALVSIAFGVALGLVGLRMRREERRELTTTQPRRVG